MVVSGRLFGLVILGALVLAGCDSTKQAFGVGGKSSPDEFTVITKAPLIIPPDFSLRPPAPGQKGPQDALSDSAARTALLGTQANQSSVTQAQAQAAGVSAGELALLREAGAENADPGIRAIVDNETIFLTEQDETFLEKVMFWQDQPEFGTTVDPSKEKKRLQENAALGDTPADGSATPTIERRKRALLEGIFN